MVIMCVILLDRFLFVHTQIASMVKFQILEEFPVDQPLHEVAFSLIFALCQIAGLAFVNNYFVFIAT